MANIAIHSGYRYKHEKYNRSSYQYIVIDRENFLFFPGKYFLGFSAVKVFRCKIYLFFALKQEM